MICSFCLKPEEEVKPVITTVDSKYRICKRCIAKAKEVMDELPDSVILAEVNFEEKPNG